MVINSGLSASLLQRHHGSQKVRVARDYLKIRSRALWRQREGIAVNQEGNADIFPIVRGALQKTVFFGKKKLFFRATILSGK